MAEGRGVKFLGWITLAAAALTCGTILVAKWQAPKRITVQEIQDSEALKDPKVGTKFELGELSGQPRVVVSLGSCMSCSIQKTDFNLLKKTGNYRPVGLYDKGAELTNVSADYSWLEVHEDQADLQGKLNSFWTPRAYAFNSDGTLVALQGPNESLARFVSRLGVGQ